MMKKFHDFIFIDVIMDQQKQSVCVIGAGPVGCLAALYFARRGWHVDVYEKRESTLRRFVMKLDMLNLENWEKNAGRSINFTISERGLEALRRFDPGLESEVLSNTVSAYARMVHLESGHTQSYIYNHNHKVNFAFQFL